MEMKKECLVCMHHCNLEEGQTGICHGRENRGGEIICKNYGQITSLALDPIEKKPLRRFFPGSCVLSVGSFGCNLRCPFCQNHEISMKGQEESDCVYLSPHKLSQKAEELKNNGNLGVAYTYNEPLVGWEYVLDTAKLVHEAGMKNVVVTNGCFDESVAHSLLPYIDAWNIDLKGFTQEWYQKLGGDLETVKNFIRLAALGSHVELTTLIVPGENDSEEEMRALCSWVASVSTEIPLHVTRFFPQYHMEETGSANVAKIYHMAEIARENLKFVYTGNC